MDDSALIARVLAGEREPFHALLHRHSPALLATLRASLGNREDAHEVLQETWLRAWQHLARLREPARLRAWLLSIALNLARARHRRVPSMGFTLGLAPGEAGEPAAPGEGRDALEDAEELARLRLLMAALPARQREVVDLRVNHELSHAEIAALLGITEEASRANHYQALRRLKDGLQGASSARTRARGASAERGEP